MTPGAVAFFVVVVLDDLDIQALASKLEAKSFCRSLAAPRHSCLKHRTLIHHNPIKSHNVCIHNNHQLQHELPPQSESLLSDRCFYTHLHSDTIAVSTQTHQYSDIIAVFSRCVLTHLLSDTIAARAHKPTQRNDRCND